MNSSISSEPIPPTLCASPPRPQKRFYSAHLPLNTELQRSGFRSGWIAWNAVDKLDVARVTNYALDVVEKELSARIEVNAVLETRLHPLDLRASGL